MATNLQFIEKTRGNSVTTLSLTNCFSSLYDVYKVVLHTADYGTTGTGDIDLRFRLIDSGGSIISDNEYNSARLMTKAESSYDQDRFENLSYMYGSVILGDYENGGCNAYIYNPNNSSSFTMMSSQGSGGYNYASTKFRGVHQIGIHKVAEQITGVNIFSSSGTSFDVTMAVYGVKA